MKDNIINTLEQIEKESKALLESEGFNIEYIEIIPRPTPMDDIGHWLDIFANGVTSHLSEEQYEVFKKETTEILKSTIYSDDNGWMLDYRRLRVKAVKPKPSTHPTLSLQYHPCVVRV